MKNKLLFGLIAAVGVVSFVSCNSDDPEVDDGPPVFQIPPPKILKATKIAEYPHNTGSFTQGLQLYKGKLYEGTGDWQNSALKIVDMESGKIEASHVMGTPEGPNGIFGEGITILNDKIYQLTWLNNIVYVYDVKDITKPIKQLKWPKQGWGITNDGKQLIISDGAPDGKLYFVNPDSFNIIRTIQVKTDKGILESINELEYVNGFIYANRWQTDVILKIDPATGNVVGAISLKSVIPEFYNSYNITNGDNVLNGIASDTAANQMIITGKRWPKLFVISIPE